MIQIFIADGRDWTNQPKVVQEVLADLKTHAFQSIHSEVACRYFALKIISNKRQIWLFWGCPKHNYVSQTNQLKACSNLMLFIKVEVYSIWKEWFLPFGRERNNWCETVSWAWLAHNLGTEGEKVFQTIPRSNYYVPPKKATNISDQHLTSDISDQHPKCSPYIMFSSERKCQS